MAYKSTRGKSGGKLIRVDKSDRGVLGQGVGGGGGAASSPLTNPIYEITFSSAPGPSGDNGQTIDLLEATDYAHRFPGPGTWTFSAAQDFPAIIELIGGGGAGGGGGNHGSSPGTKGGGGTGGDTVFSGTPVGTVTANGGSGGSGGGGGNAGDAFNGDPGTGGTADTSAATPDITFAQTTNGGSGSGKNRSTGPSGRAPAQPAQQNYSCFSVVAGGAEGGGPGGGTGSCGGGGGSGQGAYIRSNGFDIVGGVSYTFTVGGGGNGGSGPNRGPGGTGDPGAAAIQINFYDPS